MTFQDGSAYVYPTISPFPSASINSPSSPRGNHTHSLSLLSPPNMILSAISFLAAQVGRVSRCARTCSLVV